MDDCPVRIDIQFLLKQIAPELALALGASRHLGQSQFVLGRQFGSSYLSMRSK